MALARGEAVRRNGLGNHYLKFGEEKRCDGHVFVARYMIDGKYCVAEAPTSLVTEDDALQTLAHHVIARMRGVREVTS